MTVTTPGLDRPAAEERLRHLYEEHGAHLRALVTRMLRDPQHAEDIVQETLLKAWRNIHLMTEDRGSIRAWLARVAHNLAVDLVRARRVRPVEVDPDLSPQRPAKIDDPSDDLLDHLDV